MSGATGEPLEQACVHALSAAGELAAGDPAFVERHAQLAMARAVARAIEQRQALVAEAGTGVGKTFAYLPARSAAPEALAATAGAAGAAKGPRELPVPASPAAGAR